MAVQDQGTHVSSGSGFARTLDWIYESVTAGSVELAESYISRNGGDREKSIDDLVRWHVCYAGMVGFTTGVGGLFSSTIVAPLNISSVIAIQVRMIAAIAHLRGHSLDEQKVKTLVLICLTGSGVAALLQDLGLTVGKRARTELAKRGTQVAAKNFQAVLGRHVMKRFTLPITPVRLAPVVNGVVGCLIDATVTHGISSTAKLIFKSVEPPNRRLTSLAA